MANDYTTISKDGIKNLCGLIRDLASVAEGVDDLHLASNSTFSSVMIDTLIKKCLEDANEYTEKLVANLSRLELKLVTNESEITQPNILYLFKPDGATSYNQYVVIEGNKVLLGTCDIDMAQYLKIADASKTYATKTELKAVTDKIGTTTLTTTAQTLSGSIEEVKGIAEQGALLTVTKTQYDQLVAGQTVNIDGKDYTYDSNTYYVVKDDSDTIVTTTTINSSSTNSEVPTALAVEKRIKNMLVCPKDKSPKEFALENCKNGQVVEFVQWGGSHADSISAYATYKMIRGTDANWSVLVATIYDTDHRRIIKYCPYDGYRDDANKWKAWQRVVTTTVDDVPNTNITFSDETKYSIVNNTCMYFVKNGTCTVHLYVTCNASVGAWATVSSGLPKPSAFPSYGALSNPTGDKFLNYVINSSGVLQLKNGVNGISYIGTFSYPVAES